MKRLRLNSGKKSRILLLFTFLSTVAFAQMKITGSVSAADGSGTLAGASLIVKGSSNGTITDLEGKFSIIVPDEKSILIISYVGMKSEEVVVGKKKSIHVKLLPKAEELSEMIVVGYGTVHKKDLTGSITNIDSEELTKNRSGSVLEALQGKMAGVQVTSSSGEPGSGVNVSIRGNSSINAGTQPLYVIDGIQIDANSNELAQSSLGHSGSYNPLAGLNASDIESINVLKDASATAIYGSSAANGVVMITTKKGKEDLTVEFEANIGISSAIKKIDMLQGQEYADYRFARNPTYTEWGEDSDGDGILDRVKDFSNEVSVDWQDELMRTALTQSYNISIRGGGKSSLRSSASLGYLNQEGIIKKNVFERYTGLFKIEADATKKLRIGANANFSYTVGNGAVITRSNTYQGVVQSFLLFRPYNFTEDVSDPENMGLSTPRRFLEDSYKEMPLLRIRLDAYASYQIMQGLSLRITGAKEYTASKSNEWYPTTTTWGYVPKGLANITEASSSTWQNSNTLTYTKGFKGGHYVNAMAGFEFRYYEISGLRIKAENFAVQSYNPVFDIGKAMVYPENPSSYKTAQQKMSQFGRFNYTYSDKYLLTTTLRRDGSSKFGINNKYALFPSVGFAWKMQNEKFMKGQSLFNEIKPRFSFGVTGNDRIPEYRSLSRLDEAYYANLGGGSDLGLAPAEIANPDLKWETTRQTNVGVDLQLLNNRIGVVVDLYSKLTTDMLLQINVPSQSGSYRQWQNIGEISNKGLEIAVNTTNIETKNFSWTTSFNFNINRNKVLSLGSVTSIPVEASGGGEIKEIGRVIVGSPLGSGWGYVYDGVYQESDFDNGVLKEGVARIQGITSKPGDMKFMDLSGDTIVDPLNDKKIISRSDPLNFGGISNSFRYKNFDLSIFFQWSYGNEVMNIGRYYTEGDKNRLNITKEYWENRWTAENPTNKYPSIVASGKTEASSYYVEDASFIRLKTVNIGYNLEDKVCKKLKISNLRFFASADNVFTFSSYSGFDPEVQSSDKLMTGVDNVSYPRARTFNFGINLKL